MMFVICTMAFVVYALEHKCAPASARTLPHCATGDRVGKQKTTPKKRAE